MYIAFFVDYTSNRVTCNKHLGSYLDKCMTSRWAFLNIYDIDKPNGTVFTVANYSGVRPQVRMTVLSLFYKITSHVCNFTNMFS